MSPGLLSQRAMRSTISSRCSIPKRHGKHLPQDSYWQNATSTRVRSTAQVTSSATMMPPDPNIAPAEAHLVEIYVNVQATRAEHPAQRPARL